MALGRLAKPRWVELFGVEDEGSAVAEFAILFFVAAEIDADCSIDFEDGDCLQIPGQGLECGRRLLLPSGGIDHGLKQATAKHLFDQNVVFESGFGEELTHGFVMLFSGGGKGTVCAVFFPIEHEGR